jgi:hypothetical protein
MGKYDAVLIENIWHELKAIREGYESLASVPGDIAQLKSDMIDVKSELRAIKAVITNHEGRIIRLEKIS